MSQLTLFPWKRVVFRNIYGFILEMVSLNYVRFLKYFFIFIFDVRLTVLFFSNPSWEIMDSMPRRIQACINARGRATGY